MTITDYSELNKINGLRSCMTNYYVGVTEKKALVFTHCLYSYNSSQSVSSQITDDLRLDKPYKFVLTDDGKMPSFDRVLELQESMHINLNNLTKRNLLLLYGDVKEVKYNRIYSDGFLESINAENSNHPFRKMYKKIEFTSDGFLKSYSGYWGDENKKWINEYQLLYTYDENTVTVNGKRYNSTFKAEYKYDISSYGIKYDGFYDAGDYGKGVIKCQYDFNTKAMPFRMSYSSDTPPFINSADCMNYAVSFDYPESSMQPINMDINIEYGGDSWSFENLEIRVTKKDSKGN